MVRLMGVSLLATAMAFLTVASQAAAKKEAKKSDKEMSELFVGKWLMEINEKGAKIRVTMNNKKDGTFEAELKVEVQVEKMTIKNEAKLTGTWKIKNGIIDQTIKTSTDPKSAPVGDTNQDEIVSISKTELITRSVKGKNAKEELWKRVKD